MNETFQIKPVHEDEWEIRYKGATIGSIRRAQRLYSRSGTKTLYIHDNRGNERRVADVKNQQDAKVKLNAYFALVDSKIKKLTDGLNALDRDIERVSSELATRALMAARADLNAEITEEMKFRLDTLYKNGGSK